MSKPSKQFRILEKDGSYSFISRHRAQQCLDKGFAETVRKGVIRFVAQAVEPSSSAPPPKWGAAITVIPASASDSGQSGFLRYPMPWGVTTEPKFPALHRQGAGLG